MWIDRYFELKKFNPQLADNYFDLIWFFWYEEDRDVCNVFKFKAL